MSEKTELGGTERQSFHLEIVNGVECLDLQCGPNTFECFTNGKRGECMFKDPEMNHSLSKEKKQAQRITTTGVCVHQYGTTACMTERSSPCGSMTESPRTIVSPMQNTPRQHPWNSNEE
eukprot:12133729-Karenia_brevis.AAC.1